MYIKGPRLAYAHLSQPKPSAPGAEPRFSVTPIIRKDDPQLAELRAAVKAAAAAKFGANTRGLRNPLRDGDERDDSGQRVKGPEFANAVYFTASSKSRPSVVVGKTMRAPGPDDLVSGHYADIQVGIFAYDVAGNRGVGIGLNSVWINRRGEPLGFAAEAWRNTDEADDFDAPTSGASSAASSADEFMA